MQDVIVNKIAESGLITLNLETFWPAPDTIAVFDIKPFLFREMILKEKDFRLALAEYDWTPYQGKAVAITCSADAIIPMWAYMLIAVQLEPQATMLAFGTKEQLQEKILLARIEAIVASQYLDKRVVIKGCGSIPLPESAFIAIAGKLRPVVKSLMYGEPCSTVPVYKKK